MKELSRCIREPFFVFVVSSAFQPGDYLSGVAVLDLATPLAAREVVVGIRCYAKVQYRRDTAAVVAVPVVKISLRTHTVVRETT